MGVGGGAGGGDRWDTTYTEEEGDAALIWPTAARRNERAFW